ncbi:biotin transporter BioY [Cellulomonas fimi]|uniref:Biotin transporter n=1 Tax=Cellulomonas fimi (strain ATCC 484 / DSM 20113 / JCM 1341 / CCUG 24087 / LMG 16345 / NBRC 15513 / NCIMB 8980 / NCTC 7547 / NRS-133) TaxID=590998 RepID=F4H8G0_CELFA|nr:biotin transporter BioY [Cellulomonas fimi]AEE45841.1 BioY protein [Cellulomonas fimi ATCC 484]NNH07826.1 biotin transporter BioY [Cellulomonas fimi]VEH30756.1 Biotin ECF transporter S component BioY [Cellulomonas fimi]
MTDAPQQPHAPAPTLEPAPVVRSSTAADVALVSTFAAFVAVCAVLPGIPTPSGVPITLQTFGVVLAGLVLGWRRGALAVGLYLAVGLAGLPVFAEGTGGLVVLTKPSVGYLLAFPFAAAVAGAFASRALRVRPAWRYAALVAAGLGASFLTIHPAGIAGLMARLGLSLPEAFAIDVVYWPGDVVKNLLAAAVALAVLRAFPDLLRTRR